MTWRDRSQWETKDFKFLSFSLALSSFSYPCLILLHLQFGIRCSFQGHRQHQLRLIVEFFQQLAILNFWKYKVCLWQDISTYLAHLQVVVKILTLHVVTAVERANLHLLVIGMETSTSSEFCSHIWSSDTPEQASRPRPPPMMVQRDPILSGIVPWHDLILVKDFLKCENIKAGIQFNLH